MLHATSQDEAAHLGALGLKAPIAAIPNGVDVPAKTSRERKAQAPRVATFLFRVHPKKGLPMLLYTRGRS